MTNKNPKRPTGYRKPQQVAEEPRRGLLGRFLQPRSAVVSPMPKGWSSYARGLAVVMASPVLVAMVPIAVAVEWLILVATGFQGPFTFLAGMFEWPGPGTFVDTIVSSTLVPSASGALIGIFVLIIVRSMLLAFVTTASVERLRTGAVSRWALRRAVHVFPVTLTTNMLGLALYLVGTIAGQFLQQLGLGFVVFVGVLAAAVYLTAYAPAVAADESRAMPASMQRGIRTSRMRGSGTLLVAVVYTVATLALNIAYLPSAGIRVNPTIAMWAGVIVANLLNVAVAAMFAYRYLSVADFVEDPLPPTRR